MNRYTIACDKGVFSSFGDSIEEAFPKFESGWYEDPVIETEEVEILESERKIETSIEDQIEELRARVERLEKEAVLEPEERS